MSIRRPQAERAGCAVALAVMGFLLLVAPGCGGGNGSVVSAGLEAVFSASGTPAAVDRVRLSGGMSDGELVTLEVVIGGATTSQDLYSFVFDLVLSDPLVARYEAGTAQPGSALSAADGQNLSVLVSQQDDRVVVGVSKTGGGAGNGVPDGEPVIVQLDFRVLKAGATEVRLAGSPDNSQDRSADPVALDSIGTVVGSVAFDTAPATISAL